jgi:hypothetical protein
MRKPLASLSWTPAFGTAARYRFRDCKNGLASTQSEAILTIPRHNEECRVCLSFALSQYGYLTLPV